MATPQQLLLDLKPNHPPSLENFVAGGNGEVLGRLRGLAGRNTFDTVYLWGKPGCGKSHLLAATAGLAALGRPVLHLAGEDVGADITVAPGTLVALDDVERLGAEAQIALFRLFNSARLVGLAILLAGSVSPRHLQLREDLRTRIGQMLVFEVHGLSDDEKRAALRRHALLRGMRMDDALVAYLLRHGRRDLPSLMAVLDHLDRVSLEQKRTPSLPLLRELMQSPLDLDPT